MKPKRFSSANLFLLFLTLLSACVPLEKQTSEIKEQKIETANNSIQNSHVFEDAPPLPSKGYFLKPLTKKLYYFSTGKNDTLFAVTSEGTLLIDPLKSAGKLLQKAMQEIKALPVKMMIYSRGNLGRIGSAPLFSDNIRVVAHRETAKFIRDFGISNIPKPSISFGKNYSLEFGGLHINLKYLENGKDGKVIIYFPDQKVLMHVDVATPKTAPPKNLTASDIFNRAKGLKETLKYDFESYISGNYYRPGGKKEMREILNYYYATKSANKKALRSIVHKNADKRQTAADRNKSIVKNCLELLAPQWSRILKGFKISAQKHCGAWTSFHLSNNTSQKNLKERVNN